MNRRLWFYAVLLGIAGLGIGIGIGAGIWLNTSDEISSDLAECDGSNRECITLVTDFGRVTGFKSPNYNDVAVFRAIPFAEPPARFRPSVIKAPLLGELNALNFGPGCIDSSTEVQSASQSEDCLHLNIYSPRSTLPPDAPLRPVLVYIHGGQFEYGENSWDIEQPEHAVAEQNIVIVHIQYRLGPFGFWYDGKYPNLSIKDQQVALDWIQRYIKFFGGNRNEVTISGSSAGGQSVQLHLVMKNIKRRFHRAIVWSAPAIPTKSKEEAIRQYRRVARSLGCHTAGNWTCLENKTPQEIIDQTYGRLGVNVFPSLLHGLISQLAEPFAPVVDGYELIDDVFYLLRDAKVPDNTPIMFSFTKNEAETFGKLLLGDRADNETRNGVIVNNAELMSSTQTFFGGGVDGRKRAKVVLDTFDVPCSKTPTSFEPECECYSILEQITTGYTWACNMRNFAMTEAWHEKASIYINRFDLPYPKNQKLTSNPISGNPNKNCRDKSCHCVNKHWFLGAYERNTKLEEGEDRAGNIYRSYLSNLIITGNPNGDNVPVRIGSVQDDEAVFHVTNNLLGGDDLVTVHPSRNALCDALDQIDFYNQT